MVAQGKGLKPQALAALSAAAGAKESITEACGRDCSPHADRIWRETDKMRDNRLLRTCPQ